MLDQFAQKVQDLYDTFYWDEWFDYSVGSKLHWDLTGNLFNSLIQRTDRILNHILIAAIVIGCLVVLFGILILINQHKIKKMLRDLQPQMPDKSAPQESSAPEESASAAPVSPDPDPPSSPS